MKKNGFTLAEVLITLAIIGVVATMTLPALMTNTAEQQAKTALKKGINTLTEAAQMNQAIAGFDWASVTVASGSTPSPDAQSIYGLLANRTSVDYSISGTGKLPEGKGTAPPTAVTENYTVFFRDGSAISFPTNKLMDTTAAATQEDGLVYGIPVLYDTNGMKGPNILSNCNAAALGANSDNTGADLEKVCTPKQRVIKDQFGVRLRGGYAVPNGAAARWAFEN